MLSKLAPLKISGNIHCKICDGSSFLASSDSCNEDLLMFENGDFFAKITDGFYVLTIFAKKLHHRCLIRSQIHPWWCKGVIRKTVTGVEDSKKVARRYHCVTSVRIRGFSWSIFSRAHFLVHIFPQAKIRARKISIFGHFCGGFLF